MTVSPDWIGMEQAIKEILPTEGAPLDRGRLLAELSKYARAIVREARHIGDAAPTVEDCNRALDWLERPVFICGHHRSGTTLLQALLDEHPELVVLPSEASYFTSFRYVARPDPPPRDVDRFIADWIARLIDPNHEPHFKLGRSGTDGNPYLLFARHLMGWSQTLPRARPRLARLALLLALVAAFRDVRAPRSMPRLWVEKTPCNEGHVRHLAALQEAQFIQLIREPGATFASLLELYRTAGIRNTDPAGCARTIRRSLQFARTNAHRLGSRYLIVRYEDLTDDPAHEMERVRAFIGISASPALLMPTLVGRAVRSNSSFERSNPGVVEQSRRPTPLSSADARVVSAFTASPARALGYDVTPLSPWTRSTIRLGALPRRVIRSVALRVTRRSHRVD